MKISEILKILKKSKILEILIFSIFKGISIIFEKSCFRKILIFFKNFENFKIFETSTLTDFIFRSTQRIFLIFFYGSKWIFEADRTYLSEFALESTGKNDYRKVNFGTVKTRNYIKYCPVSWNNTLCSRPSDLLT